MGLFGKKPKPLDYSSGAGYFPKVEANSYLPETYPNRSHVYLFNMDLAALEQPYNKANFVFSEISKTYEDPTFARQVKPYLDKYSGLFCKKIGIQSASDEETLFRNIMVFGMIMSFLEQRSGLNVPNMIHPSVQYYLYQLADTAWKNNRQSWINYPDFRGRVDQAIRGGYIIFKHSGNIEPDILWSSI